MKNYWKIIENIIEKLLKDIDIDWNINMKIFNYWTLLKDQYQFFIIVLYCIKPRHRLSTNEGSFTTRTFICCYLLIPCFERGQTRTNIKGYHLLITKFIASSPNFLLNYHKQCLLYIYFFITKFNYVSPKYLLFFYTNFQSPNFTNFTIKGFAKS